MSITLSPSTALKRPHPACSQMPEGTPQAVLATPLLQENAFLGVHGAGCTVPGYF